MNSSKKPKILTPETTSVSSVSVSIEDSGEQTRESVSDETLVRAKSLETLASTTASDNPVFDVFEPLANLLENQFLLLKAARNTKSELTALDKPRQVCLQVLSQSPYKHILMRKNLDVDIFLNLFLAKHEAIMVAINESRQQGSKDKSKSVGEIVNHFNEKFFTDLGALCENPVELSALNAQLTRSIFSPASTALIFQSLYVLAFAHFEHFLASLTRSILLQRDELLGELQETFTWAQIRRPSDVENLKQKLIDQIIGKLLRLSMGQWIAWYIKKNKMKIFDELKDECELLYDWRNLFVHENSVRALYTTRANFELIERVCDCLGVLAVFMSESAAIANEINNVSDDFYDQLTLLEVRLLDQSRLELVNQICLRALSKQDPPASINLHRVNSWIARKRQGESENLKSELLAWDADQLGPLFALAKLVLVDDFESAIEEAKLLLDQGVLLQRDWDSWPLFDEVREMANFK